METNEQPPSDKNVLQVAALLGVTHETAALWLAEGRLVFSCGESQTFFRLRDMYKNQRLVQTSFRA